VNITPRGLIPCMKALSFTTVADGATLVHMKREISVRQLRNETASVVSLVESGEPVTLTVNRRPVADIIPHIADRDPWVPATELRRILAEAPADPGLMDDLREIREAPVVDPAA